MPARSRSGERFRRRSGSERAGSPSKSITTQSPSRRPEHLAEVVVPVRPDREARRAGADSSCEVAEVLQTVRDRSERVASGMVANVVAISSSIAAPSRPIASALGPPGRSAGRCRARRAQRGARGHLAEAPGALGEPGGVVLERVERELPAAPIAGTSAVTDARAVSSGGPGVSSAPSSRARSRTGRPPARGAAPAPGWGRPRAAVQLQHVQLVEHDRAVRLLDAERADARALGADAGERRGRPPPASRARRPARRPRRTRAGSARACPW